MHPDQIARLQGSRVAAEPSARRQNGEISAGILFRDRPHPCRYTDPQAKAGSAIKPGEKNFLLKKFGIAVPKA
jgi:hypothetical protein